MTELSALTPLEIAYCVAVLLLAYGLRGSTGFGGVIGMALIAVVLPIKVVIPAWTLLGITSSAAILGHDHRHVAWRAMLPFVPWMLVGIAIGLYFFKSLDPTTLARGLGVLVILYAAYSFYLTLHPATGWRLPASVLAPTGGIAAGVVGTIFGTLATVFFVMYLDARRLAKQAFRATMSAMLFTLALVRGAGYYAVGEFTRDALLLFAVAFPVMLVGIWGGDRIHVRLDQVTFQRLICGALFLSGVPLVLR